MRYCYVAYVKTPDGARIINVYETVGAAEGACTVRASKWNAAGKAFHESKWVEDTERGLYKRGHYRVLQVTYQVPNES